MENKWFKISRYSGPLLGAVLGMFLIMATHSSSAASERCEQAYALRLARLVLAGEGLAQELAQIEESLKAARYDNLQGLIREVDTALNAADNAARLGVLTDDREPLALHIGTAKLKLALARSKISRLSSGIMAQGGASSELSQEVLEFGAKLDKEQEALLALP